ncbi:hypothetical protein DM49_177 [Burkholderia mallei]|nr:hypothetical protein DM49_177 [Burkholderia mallei]
MFFNGVMLKTPMPTQHELEMVTLEELVPKDHLLRQIDAAVDFEFLRAKVAHLYCADNGRPALDPVVMFKLLFIGYLFGVRSERQLMREVQVNVAYRWFARFRLTDKVPDASTFSQNRRRRFTDTTVYQEIFDEIVRQAIKRGLVDGRVLYTDSTHLKANANKGKFDVVKLEQTPAAYTEALNAAVDADRARMAGSRWIATTMSRRLARTPSSAGPIRTAATWRGTTSRRGSSIWTTARWMPSTRSSPIRM